MSEINIVLLGATGVGKSTCINALANHLNYNQFQDAKRSFIQLIPTTFMVTHSDLQTEIVSTGQHPNECHQTGISATRTPMKHQLTYENRTLQIIDTPGLGDTGGMQNDEQNATKIVSFIGQLNHVHAVCIFLRPGDSRLNVLFSFCIKSILSRLDRSILGNIVFVFTNGRETSFRVDDAIQPLNLALLQASPSGAIIRATRENTFCVDNEAFRYLAARTQGIRFSAEEEDIYKHSWNKSALEYTRFLQHVVTLSSSSAHMIVSVTDSKMVMSRMAKPLIEMMILQEKAIARIKIHRGDVQLHQNSVEELKSRLYVPVIEYKITKKTITDSVVGQKVQVGASFLQMMFGINAGYKYQNTTETHCEETVEPYETRREDSFVKGALLNETNKFEAVKQNLEKLMRLQEEYTDESLIITEAAAKFVVFLMRNAVTVDDRDPFQTYIKSAIAEERACNATPELIDSMERLLTRYQLKKQSLTEVTPDDVTEAISNLLGLNHAGPVFRRLYNPLR